MAVDVTILVVPRDRFSSVVSCVRSIVENTKVPYRLVVLDFGYGDRTIERIRQACGDTPVEFESMGTIIPMTALKEYLPKIDTKYVAWVDNDTYVTPGWLTACLGRAKQGAQVVLPVTLERDGMDADPRKIPLRNHISHGELRKVQIGGREFVFDYKPYRRAAPDEIPSDAHTVDFFEFHAVFMETEVLRRLDIPDIVMREHVDIGIQLNKLGIPIWCEPTSIVQFDNIRERPSYRDLKFFFFRWGRGLVEDAHRQFEQRWGYRFMNEQFIKNWAFRRKVFSVLRFGGIPQRPADFCSRAMVKLFCKPIPQKFIDDPLPSSERVLEPVAIDASAQSVG